MTAAHRVWVPGHITGFFMPVYAADPVRTGSMGGGIALSDGVTVTVTRSSQTEVMLNGRAVEIPPVGAVLERLGVTGRVDAATPLPLGVGFGVSGAMTLAAALGAQAAGLIDRPSDDLVRIAHVAEVASRTGLGDVMGQATGGISLRLRPGAPPLGRVERLPAAPTIEYLIFGSRSTTAVLDGAEDRLVRAGRDAVRMVRANPSLEAFMSAAARFTTCADLAGPQVQQVLERVDAVGHHAAMVMIGESVFSCDGGLSAAGYRPREATVASGPRVL
mgnify:CR=1 FL=1